MRAVLVKSIADLRRRRVQAAVIFVTVLLAMATGTMALTLVSQTRDPCQTAFAAQKGAHLQVAFIGTADPQLVASTPAIIGASVLLLSVSLAGTKRARLRPPWRVRGAPAGQRRGARA